MKLTPLNPHFTVCDQQWEGMPQQDDGRLCQTCDKVLLDFTHCTEAEMMAILREKEFNQCGLFTDEQTDLLRVNMPREKAKTYIPWLVAMAMGMASAIPFAANGQDVELPIYTVPIPGASGSEVPILNSVSDSVILLKGRVVSKKGAPLGIAHVSNNFNIPNSYANRDGYFSIEVSLEKFTDLPNTIVITFWKVGYKSKQYQLTIDKDKLEEKEVSITLEKLKHYTKHHWIGTPRF